MWVVKLGGSLYGDHLLPQWVALLSELGGGRVAIVPGGGGFADEVRRAQGHWRFDDLSAHNMAVLAMSQGAYLLRGLSPSLQLVHAESDIRDVLHRAGVAVWSPLALLREVADDDTNWDVTGDSIALALARRLNAERLILVKSCAIAPDMPLHEMSAAGIVDKRFAESATLLACETHVVSRDALASVRELLLGAGRAPAAALTSRRR